MADMAPARLTSKVDVVGQLVSWLVGSIHQLVVGSIRQLVGFGAHK